ncbi:MAG: hypothetical protein VB035_02680 [Candidatus Fimivivens sp.]|nr:hypothetical protein [Candidatus Fimivivens sp.]
MIEVQTWSDVLKLNNRIDSALYDHIETRFRTLHQNYCAAENICQALSEFSLADYGAIVLVQSYEELKPLIIETAWMQTLKAYGIFVALVPVNNSTCKEYLIPHALMTPKQIEAFKGEYCL